KNQIQYPACSCNTLTASVSSRSFLWRFPSVARACSTSYPHTLTRKSNLFRKRVSIPKRKERERKEKKNSLCIVHALPLDPLVLLQAPLPHRLPPRRIHRLHAQQKQRANGSMVRHAHLVPLVLNLLDL